MGPTSTLDQALAPLRPLGQFGDGEVDRAARVPKGQRGGGNRCPPRRQVSFFSRPPLLALSAATISKVATKAPLNGGTLVQIPQRRGIQLAFVHMIQVGPAKAALLDPRSIPAFEAEAA
jgi:hypothetical protein